MEFMYGMIVGGFLGVIMTIIVSAVLVNREIEDIISREIEDRGMGEK